MRQLSVNPFVAVAALMAALALPAAATGDPLLSGYGGPGQGSQVIIGATLGGGSGSEPPHEGGSGTGPARASGAQGRNTGPGSTVGGASQSRGGRPATRSPSRIGSAGAHRSPSEAQQLAAQLASLRASAEPSSGVLGLSGENLLLVVLVTGALGFVAILTKRLARGAPL